MPSSKKKSIHNPKKVLLSPQKANLELAIAYECGDNSPQTNGNPVNFWKAKSYKQS